MTPRGHNMRHRHDEHRQGQRRADPEPAAHVPQLGVVVLHIAHGGDGFWFERHAALGAVTGMILLDLRVHRAGVDGFRGRLPRGIAFQRHAAFRTITRLVGFHSGTHRAKVFGGGGRCHRCVHRDHDGNGRDARDCGNRHSPSRYSRNVPSAQCACSWLPWSSCSSLPPQQSPDAPDGFAFAPPQQPPSG
jgi:hypothetical protein